MWCNLLLVPLLVSTFILCSEGENSLIRSPIFYMDMEERNGSTLHGFPVDYQMTGSITSEPSKDEDYGKAIFLHNDRPILENFVDDAAEFATASMMDIENNEENECFRNLNCTEGMTVSAWVYLKARTTGDFYGCNHILGHSGLIGQSLAMWTYPPQWNLLMYLVQQQHHLVRVSCWYYNVYLEERWMHLAVTGNGTFANGTEYSVYMDGKLTKDCTTTHEESDLEEEDDSSKKMYLGCSEMPGVQDGICKCGLHGLIDEVRIYSEQLTNRQIKRMYKNKRKLGTKLDIEELD